MAYSTSGAPASADLVPGAGGARVHFVAGDIGDLQKLRETAAQFDVRGIIHTAALTGEAQARANPQKVFSVNVAGTANVLELVRLEKLRRVVYIASAAEYGRRPDLRPIGEDEVNVEGLYAETKFLGHRLGQRYREVFGIDVLTVRVSSIYGPNTRVDPLRGLVGGTLIAHLCRTVAMGEALTLEGGSDSGRDWTHAADAAEGICLAYDAHAPRHRVYNIGAGRLYTLVEVVDAIRRVEPSAAIRIGHARSDDDPFHAANVRGPLDISRARQDLGYAPAHELERGLREYIACWRRMRARA